MEKGSASSRIRGGKKSKLTCKKGKDPVPNGVVLLYKREGKEICRLNGEGHAKIRGGGEDGSVGGRALDWGKRANKREKGSVERGYSLVPNCKEIYGPGGGGRRKFLEEEGKKDGRHDTQKWRKGGGGGGGALFVFKMGKVLNGKIRPGEWPKGKRVGGLHGN